VGQIKYSLVTNEQGGILDDVLAYHLVEPAGTHFMWLVVNAGNRDKIKSWVQQHLSSDVQFTDETEQTAMIAVQGPHAMALADQFLADLNPAELAYYSGVSTTVAGQRGIVSRTGYTGEDGVEIIVPNDAARIVWQSLIENGAANGVLPAGLGARDTLRLEAAMPLYGHELHENVDPYQAGLRFAVNVSDREFIGRAALAAASKKESPLRLVGLRLAGRRVPREHYPITHEGQSVGEVTSGTFSPTLECPIAMGYVSREYGEVGSELGVDVRGKTETARVVKLPFYKRAT
jgi:aminomethyltransferase